MKIIPVISLFAFMAFLFASYAVAQYVEPIRTTDIPPTFATDPITIDCDDSEAAYGPQQNMQIAKRAGAANPHGLEDGDPVDFNAWFKAAYDLDYLYLYIEVTDDIEESYSEGKSDSWTWDNVEIFIDLDTNSTTNIYSNASTIQLRYCRSYGVETPGRVAKTDFLVEEINDASMWIVEIGVPWTAAAATGVVPDMLEQQAEGIIGFDLAVADADGDGTGSTGGRNFEGGAQAFWDPDTPIENADNAYQNRRVFGWAALTGIGCDPHPCDNISDITPDLQISIYPNPAGDHLIINAVNSSDLHGCNVNITNLLGETLLVKEIDQHSCKIDLSTLSSRGLHFIYLIDKAHNLLQVNKIILQ